MKTSGNVDYYQRLYKMLGRISEWILINVYMTSMYTTFNDIRWNCLVRRIHKEKSSIKIDTLDEVFKNLNKPDFNRNQFHGVYNQLTIQQQSQAKKKS